MDEIMSLDIGVQAESPMALDGSVCCSQHAGNLGDASVSMPRRELWDTQTSCTLPNHPTLPLSVISYNSLQHNYSFLLI